MRLPRWEIGTGYPSNPDTVSSACTSQPYRAMALPRAMLQNWEQGRRRPHGPARVLLRVAEEHPEAVLDVVKKAG
jgi:hypothetical protein